jgi:hypothetical protein
LNVQRTEALAEPRHPDSNLNDHRHLSAWRAIRSFPARPLLSVVAFNTLINPSVHYRRFLVTRSSRTWMGRAAGALALAVALTAVAPPASAAEAAAPLTGGRSRLAASTAARLATLSPAKRAFAQTQPAADSSGTGDSRSFFRSKTGIAAIVLMVAGAAYVAYSIPKDNEKVHSPIR